MQEFEKQTNMDEFGQMKSIFEETEPLLEVLLIMHTIV